MKKLLGIIVTLFIAFSVQAQETSRYFGGDYKFTPDEFTINANTADGTDDGRFNLTGGGGTGTSSTRGGFISLYGADRGGAGAGGDVWLVTADNGDILLNATGASGYINFSANAEQKWRVVPTATGTAILEYSPANSTNWWGLIRSTTIDGTDDSRFTLASGGNYGATRGAWIDLYGADRGGAGAGGDILINSADAGNIAINSNAGATYFNFAGETKFTVYPAAASTSILEYGGSTANWITLIRAGTSDGSDSSTLNLMGGGGASPSASRGAHLVLRGSDVGGAGLGGGAFLIAGDDGNVEITAPGSGYLVFETDNILRWNIPPQGAGLASLVYGANNTPTSASILGSTVDGNDGGVLYLSGGGNGIGTTRGGFIELQGRDYGGADLGGAVTLRGAGPAGHVNLFNSGGVGWYVDAATGDFVDTTAVAGIIRNGTADAADTKSIQICGGGACATTRGADINIVGRDFGGADAGGQITLRGAGPAGIIYLLGGSTGLGWSVNADGTLDSNLTNIGWRVVATVAAACTATCGANKGCVVGYNPATTSFADCTAVITGTCLCTTT